MSSAEVSFEEDRPEIEHHGEAEVRSAIAGLRDADRARLTSAARIWVRQFKLDAVHLGVRDLVAEAIARTLGGERKWRCDLGITRHLIETMKSIASTGRKQARRAAAAGFRVERQADFSPPDPHLDETEEEAADDPLAAAPSPDRGLERMLAADEIRVFRRHFAGDPAALAVIDGWMEGWKGPDIQARNGLEHDEFQAAVRRVRRFAQRLGDDADDG